jgi:hypothetical protein
VSDAPSFFRDVAYKQLMPLVIAEVYNAYKFENPGIRGDEKRVATYSAAGQALFTRIESLQQQISKLDRQVVCPMFLYQLPC